MAKPDDAPSFDEMDLRLGQEMARCARDYDAAREELAAHHGEAGKRIAGLRADIARLQPTVDAVTNGEGPGLTPGVAKKLLRYLDLNAQLRREREGQRLAFPATLAPGAARIGGAIGDPVSGAPGTRSPEAAS